MQAALTTQFRVIGALILRETRATFGTSQIGYLWAIITPAASTAVLVAIFSVAGRHPPFGPSLALFFALGTFTLEFFTKLGSSLMTVFEANKALLSYPPIKEPDVLFARATLIAATYALIMGVFFSCLTILDLAEPPAFPAAVMEAFAITGLLGLGYGATNAILITVFDSWRHIEKVLSRPLMFISGVFYVPSYMPPQVVDWIKWNPVLHCIEWMRSGYYSNYDSNVLDRGYVLTVAVCLIFLGLAGERLTRSRRTRS